MRKGKYVCQLLVLKTGNQPPRQIKVFYFSLDVIYMQKLAVTKFEGKSDLAN